MMFSEPQQPGLNPEAGQQSQGIGFLEISFAGNRSSIIFPENKEPLAVGWPCLCRQTAASLVFEGEGWNCAVKLLDSFRCGIWRCVLARALNCGVTDCPT